MMLEKEKAANNKLQNNLTMIEGSLSDCQPLIVRKWFVALPHMKSNQRVHYVNL